MILELYQKFPFILDMNLAKANCTENHVCTSCDTVVLGATNTTRNAPTSESLYSSLLPCICP